MKKEIPLSYFPKMTFKRYQQILKAFSDLDHFWNAPTGKLGKLLKWDDNLVHDYKEWKETFDEEKQEKILDQQNIHCITREDIEYPELLKQIYDPPICLFVRGDLKNCDYPLAVVGTRKFSSYGKQIADELVRELARKGLSIISGLALGIDGIAHTACMEAGGKTVAVLGTGVDKAHVYPAAHKNVAERIVESGGAVTSEYPPGALPTKFSFPRRNRIIAGMSLGTLVIEAGETSGALITAQCSLDNNREVFSIPHNITSKNGIGPNNLLKQGAHPVTCAKDILEILSLDHIEKFVENKEVLPDSPVEAKLLEHLSREALHVDELRKKTGLSSHEINSTLTLMEMKGKVRNLGGMNYVLSR